MLDSHHHHLAWLQVAFLDAPHTPLEVAFAHTGSLSRSWQQLGSMQLSRDDRQQLQHVFRLGAKHSIQRYLHISFSGHLLCCTSGQICCCRCKTVMTYYVGTVKMTMYASMPVSFSGHLLGCTSGRFSCCPCKTVMTYYVGTVIMTIYASMPVSFSGHLLGCTSGRFSCCPSGL